MFLVMLVYSLLAMPISGSLKSSFSFMGSETLVTIGMAGMRIVYQTDASAGENVKRLFSRLMEDVQFRKGAGSQSVNKTLIKAARKSVQIQSIDVSLRIGCEEAWSTALAAGGAKAGLLSVLSILSPADGAQACVIPDFHSPVFCASLGCIFSARAGDIMFIAAKSIVKKAAEKGFCHAAASHSESDGHFHGKHPGNGGCQYCDR